MHINTRLNMSLVQPFCTLQSSQQEQCDTFKAQEAYDRARTDTVFLCVCVVEVGVSDREEHRSYSYCRDSSDRGGILKLTRLLRVTQQWSVEHHGCHCISAEVIHRGRNKRQTGRRHTKNLLYELSSPSSCSCKKNQPSNSNVDWLHC